MRGQRYDSASHRCGPHSSHAGDLGNPPSSLYKRGDLACVQESLSDQTELLAIATNCPARQTSAGSGPEAGDVRNGHDRFRALLAFKLLVRSLNEAIHRSQAAHHISKELSDLRFREELVQISVITGKEFFQHRCFKFFPPLGMAFRDRGINRWFSRIFHFSFLFLQEHVSGNEVYFLQQKNAR